MVLKDITFAQKISELHLELQHPHSKRKLFLYVEGITDVRIFRSLLSPDQFRIESIPGGNIGVLNAITNLERTYSNIMGVLDADFLHISKAYSSVSSIVYTDYHDMEMTMLSDMSIFRKLFVECTLSAGEDHQTFFLQICKQLLPISKAKYVNHIKPGSLDFDFSFSVFFDPSRLRLEHDRYFHLLIQRSNCSTIPDIETLKELEDYYCTQEFDLFQITNGHDFLSLFHCFIRHKYVGKVPSVEALHSYLRVSYSMSQFEKTNMFKKIDSKLQLVMV